MADTALELRTIALTAGAPSRPRHGLRDRPSQLPTDEAGVMARRLTLGYVTGLGLLAAATLGGSWLINNALTHRAYDATIINQAGAQAMLSQRIASLALMKANGGSADHDHATAELPKAVARMAASHVNLSRIANNPHLGSPDLMTHYFTGETPLDLQVTRFLQQVRNLEGDAAQARAVSQDALDVLLPRLAEAVALHEDAAKGRADRIAMLHKAIVGLALALMLAEAIIIFRPLVRRTVSMTAQLKREACTDPLTGLMNRRAVIEALTETLPHHTSVAVVAIDLDHFKRTNDTDGHAAGDAMLRAAAERLRATVRDSDLIGRIGGDEFLVFLFGIATETEVMEVAQRMRDALHLPVPHNGRLLRLGATLGVAIAPTDTDEVEGLLRAADEALIRTKRAARGKVGRVTRDDVARTRRDASILRALTATDIDKLPGFTAHLQPIIDLADGKVRGVEALARWTSEELGPIPPDEFFAAAQKLGLAAALSEAARGHAMAAFAKLRREGLDLGRLQINVSAPELMRDDMVDAFERQCRTHGLALSDITVEITEDVLLDRVSHTTLDRLCDLRARGVLLSLDDFGTGTSGLLQLLRLPLDEIKLDRSFVSRLGVDERARQIVEGTIRMAQSMRLAVVAEGIEDEAREQDLRNLGSAKGQGWLYAPAMPVDALRDWLKAHAPQRETAMAQDRHLPAA
jgi:diguanylate cyclase (GGDEF)-like protein